MTTCLPKNIRDVKSMLVWCWTSVADAGPTSNQYRLNVSCWLGSHSDKQTEGLPSPCGVGVFYIPGCLLFQTWNHTVSRFILKPSLTVTPDLSASETPRSPGFPGILILIVSMGSVWAYWIFLFFHMPLSIFFLKPQRSEKLSTSSYTCITTVHNILPAATVIPPWLFHAESPMWLAFYMWESPLKFSPFMNVRITTISYCTLKVSHHFRLECQKCHCNVRRKFTTVFHCILYVRNALLFSPCMWEGGGPRVVVSTAAFHARVRGSVPGLGGLKETKLFLPHPRVKVSIVGSLRDREVACSASDRQGSNFESCVWRTVSSQSSHHPQEVLLAQFSLYVHKGGLKPDSFHFILHVGIFNV